MDVPIQAAIGKAAFIERETVAASAKKSFRQMLRAWATFPTKRKKFSTNKRRAKRRMKASAEVDIPQEAFPRRL